MRADMSGHAKASRLKALAITAAAVVAGIAAVYVTLGPRDNAGMTPASKSSQALGARLNSGEMAAFIYKQPAEAPAAVAFKTKDGRELSLADWKGRVVLLNLWATWCAPCRKEMPALDRLQKELGSKDFEVVALAVDRAGTDAAAKFLDQVEARNLGLYVDGTAKAGTALKAIGLPTTLLLDREGREIGRLTGPAEWDGADAKRLIAAAMK